MRYVSTRGEAQPVSFADAVLVGLAPDGGLLLPESVPDVSAELRRWRALPYAGLAFEVMRPYADLPDDALRGLVARSYASFRHPDVAPVVQVGGVYVAELFHGPTLAFKDVALQFLGNLFEHLLSPANGRLNLLAATSGDTGSAAICGVRGRLGISIFVLHPRGRVSATQEQQMTTVLDANVHNAAVEGTFDDCQNIVKSIFRDLPFKEKHALGAVNSINWARVLAQVVYYFHGVFRVMDATGAGRVDVCVPTGNFGNVFAGYIAWRMGLPIGRLILAANENDILARFFNTGVYSLGRVVRTISPSMDIQVASNFERYLYYRAGEDGGAVRRLMAEFSRNGRLALGDADALRTNAPFVSAATDRAGTLDTIRRFHREHGYLLDPHSAVGVRVGLDCADGGAPLLCLATAHPAKFADAIREATGQDCARHPLLDGLKGLPARCEVLPASQDAVRRFIESRLGRDR